MSQCPQLGHPAWPLVLVMVLVMFVTMRPGTGRLCFLLSWPPPDQIVDHSRHRLPANDDDDDSWQWQWSRWSLIIIMMMICCQTWALEKRGQWWGWWWGGWWEGWSRCREWRRYGVIKVIVGSRVLGWKEVEGGEDGEKHQRKHPHTWPDNKINF